MIKKGPLQVFYREQGFHVPGYTTIIDKYQYFPKLKVIIIMKISQGYLIYKTDQLCEDGSFGVISANWRVVA